MRLLTPVDTGLVLVSLNANLWLPPIGRLWYTPRFQAAPIFLNQPRCIRLNEPKFIRRNAEQDVHVLAFR